MKRKYLLVQLFLFLAIGCCYSQPQKELLDKDWHYTKSPEEGVHYRIITKNREYNPHGLVVHFYGEDSIQMKGNLAGASPEGEYSYFYSNGRLESKGTFAEGYKTGFWEEWYSSGQIRTRGKHITTDDKFNFTNQPKTEYVIESFWDSTGMQLTKDGTGPYFSTYDGSKIKEKGQFLSGYKSGAWTGYFENGNILFEEKYDKGVLLSGISYNPAGQKFEYDERSKEKMPEFKGGMSALQRYLQKSLRYPAAARRLRAQGFVYVRFLVSEAGTLTDISLFTKGPDISLEEEALRVVRAMPEWKPGEEHGQPVRVEYVLPVRFIMQ